jgi:predicted permease
MVGYPILHGLIIAKKTSAARGRTDVRTTICRALFMNPVVWGVSLGLTVSATNWNVPGPMETFISVLAGAAAPGALFAIGLSLRNAVRSLRAGHLRIWPIGVAAVAKLALLPAITAVFMTLIAPELPYVWKVCLILMAGMPTSATAFVLAQADNGDGKTTGAIIVFTNAASILTLPLVAQVFIVGS